MNKKLLYILIAFICVSLLGIIGVQFFWIRNAFQVNESQFNRSVNDALGSVVKQMETRENMHFISRNFEGDSIMKIVKAYSKDTSNSMKERLESLLALNEDRQSEPKRRETERVRRSSPSYISVTNPTSVLQYSYLYNILPLGYSSDSISVSVEEFYQNVPVINLEDYQFEWNDQLERLDSIIEINENQFILAENLYEKNKVNRDIDRSGSRNSWKVVTHTPKTPDPVVIDHSFRSEDNSYFSRSVRSSGKKKKEIKEKSIQLLDNKAKRIEEVIKKMAMELETTPAPLQQRINKKNLQATLQKAFDDKGIDLPFEFAVYTPSNDSNPLPIQSSNFENNYLSTNHRITLFPNDLFQKPDLLLVHFPGQQTQMLKSLLLLLAGSILFTLIIILSSGASIVVMIRQKKISDIKTDFINNMTHEFKTPIATISIAADSINNARVIQEPEKIKDFTRIIKEENNRMNARVEQVLQMALLDSRDFKLRPGIIDMHWLIDKALNTFRLQIEKRNGTIQTIFEATNPIVEADEDHMRNVLMNLLDNANKYSGSKPEINVFTYNRGGKFYFGVGDKGIGMNQDTQRKVFDKFFRVATGNIHNIKGFGLGLSYVKAIVLAHQGEVNLTSEIGRGSRFEIGLPVALKEVNGENGMF